MAEVLIYPDVAALAGAAAERFVAASTEAIRVRGRFLVALSGGSTPRATYALLATGPFAGRVDWTRVHVLWGDERCVPPDHPESNYRMAREVLLDKVPLPSENVHRIRGECPLEEAATAYQAELEALLGSKGRIDLVFLGMGADGHVASLFPDEPALEEQERLVVAVASKGARLARVTLALPAINAARQVVFLVAGRAKTVPLAHVFASEPLPAGRVHPLQGQLVWLVDREAAQGLV